MYLQCDTTSDSFFFFFLLQKGFTLDILLEIYNNMS